jgi:hypothetical protein
MNRVFIGQTLLLGMLTTMRLAAQSLPVDSLLVRQEKLKWQALSRGEFGKHPEWMTADFMNIGYLPDGTVMRYRKGEQVPNPGQAPGKKLSLPPATFAVSDFHVLTASPDVRIVTYQARGPLNLFVSSTWVRQGSVWKTLFYQATAFTPVP